MGIGFIQNIKNVLEKPMKKHLQNLERLCMKMQARYGDNDDLVMTLKQELLVLQERKPKGPTPHNFGRRDSDKAKPSQSVH